MSKPMFQRWHYEAVAVTLKELKKSYLVTVTEDTSVVWHVAVEYFVITFKRDNPQFKPERFRVACGMED